MATVRHITSSLSSLDISRMGRARRPLRTAMLPAVIVACCTGAAASYVTAQDAQPDDQPTSKPAPATHYAFRESDEGVELREKGRPVFFFQLRERSLDGGWPRSHYLHPVYDLAGKVLTEDFPEDHRHHRGIFWAWHQLKHQGRPLADPWACRGIQWKPPADASLPRGDRGAAAARRHPAVWTRTGEKQAELRVVRHWTVDINGRPTAVVEDDARITTARRDGRRQLDFVIRLRALLPEISIGGSENAKGYGGFSTRLALSPPIEFHGETGEVQPQVQAVNAGPWLAMVRTGEAQRPQASTASLTLLCHPSHPAFPAPWILRSKRSMQNVAWPGRHATPLPTEKPVELRYRLLIHEQPLPRNTIAAEWRRYLES